jgi:hypothetical protein
LELLEPFSFAQLILLLLLQPHTFKLPFQPDFQALLRHTVSGIKTVAFQILLLVRLVLFLGLANVIALLPTA